MTQFSTHSITNQTALVNSYSRLRLEHIADTLEAQEIITATTADLIREDATNYKLALDALNQLNLRVQILREESDNLKNQIAELQKTP